MTFITFVRHGSTYWNKEGRAQGHSDNPLDDEGLAQARAVARRLGSERWDAIYSSDLQRARQTAEAIGAEIGGTDRVRFDPRLREMYGGQIEGTTEAERVERWGPDWRTLDLGLETAEAGMARGGGFVDELIRSHPGGRILLVSHGAIIRHTLRGLVPEAVQEDWLRNTSVTTIRRGEDGRWSCELYNCTKHLEEGESAR